MSGLSTQDRRLRMSDEMTYSSGRRKMAVLFAGSRSALAALTKLASSRRNASGARG